MKEQLINFETAKLAKEKGLPQDNFYFEDYEARVPFYGLDNELNKGDEDRFGQCKSISQSLLAKWLREKHNLYVSPRESYAFDGTLEFVCTVNGIFINHNYKDKPVNRFETFEEAYEIGLQEALKLI